MPSKNFEVNTMDRNDVVAFWHAVYMSSEGYEKRIQWTGGYLGNNGTTSREFLNDVERRLNFYRAMCGIPSGAEISTTSTVVVTPQDRFQVPANQTKSAAAQAGAMMMARTYREQRSFSAMSHDPEETAAGWSPLAWNGNANGNLAFGVFGPGAISQYILEERPKDVQSTTWNASVGHRRWCLFPRSTQYASGDQPGYFNLTEGVVPPTNVLYVSQNSNELATIESPVFVAYPPAGFVPAPMNSPFWSISRSGADFSTAQVTVKRQNGTQLAISELQFSKGFGDPALIWRMPEVLKSVYNDMRYDVKVTGIQGINTPTELEYSVTLIHPDRLTSSHLITGSATPVTRKSTRYTFTPPVGAEAISIGVGTYEAASWKENAEAKKQPGIIDLTASSYPIICKMDQFKGFGSIEGKSAYRLTFPVSYDMTVRGTPEQIFELNRDLIPSKGASLNFRFKRGLMSTNTGLVVEGTTDGGVSWKTMTSIMGLSDNSYKPATFSKKVPLPVSANPLRIRFRLYSLGGVIFPHSGMEKLPTGIFIDDITVKNSKMLTLKKDNLFSGTTKSFTLNQATAGKTLAVGEEWALRMRAKLGGKWFPYGPLKKVKVVKR